MLTIALLLSLAAATSALPRGLPVETIKANLRGPVCQVLTCFNKDESVDWTGIRAQVSSCVVQANSSVVLLTTADSGFSFLSDDEIRNLTKTVVDHTRAVQGAREVVVVAAAAPWWTSKVVAFAEFAKQAGADVLMVRPMDDVLPTNGNEGAHVRQRGLVDLFSRAAAVMPMLIVGCAGAFTFEVLDAVAESSPNFCCYKLENPGNMSHNYALLQRYDKRIAFIWGGGPVPELPTLFAKGARGSMSILAQGLSPATAARFWAALNAGDSATVSRLTDVQERLVRGLRHGVSASGEKVFADGFPGGFESGVRAALEVQGVSQRYMRLPQDSAADGDLGFLRTLLSDLVPPGGAA